MNTEQAEMGAPCHSSVDIFINSADLDIITTTGYGCDLYVEHIQHITRAYIFQVRKMKPMWKCLKPEFYLKIIW